MAKANIKATLTPVVKKGAGSPLNLTSPAKVRTSQGRLGNELAAQLATDLDNIRTVVNSLFALLQVPQQLTNLLLTNEQGQVIAGVGNILFEGKYYTNFFSEIHVGNSLLTRNPAQAVFNANTDGSVTVGESGWLDVHDPFKGNAAWIGTQNNTLRITNAVNNGANGIRLTVENNTLITGNVATVRNMQNAGVPNATGIWQVTVVGPNTVDLIGPVWAGVFTMPDSMGGIETEVPTIDRILQVEDAYQTPAETTIRLKFGIATGYESGTAVNVQSVNGVPNATGQWITSIPATLDVTGAVDNGAGLIRLEVPGHNFVTGDRPEVTNVGGVPNANGYWYVTVIDDTFVDLDDSNFDGAYTSGGTISFLNANVVDLAERVQTELPSVFAGSYVSGGTCLEYYAGILAQTIAIGRTFEGYKLRAFPSGDLRIKNANIELSSDSGSIVLNPNTTQIILKNFDNLSSIVLDATVPALTFSDQTGNPTVTLQIQQEAAIAIATATNASPTIIEVTGNTYVDGDTILIQGEPPSGNAIINGYRIVQNRDTVTGKFEITDLQGNTLNGSGTYSGGATAARYYAGLLAQTLALGSSFAAYRLRFFADGTLKVNNADIEDSTITNSTVDVTSFTSRGGTPPNELTLTIANGLLTIAGTGTAAGTGDIDIDGEMKAGSLDIAADAAVGGNVDAATYSVGGAPGFTGTVPIGAGSLDFVNGIATAYTP